MTELDEQIPTSELPAIDVPAVLFNISRLWQPGLDEDEVYDAASGWWVMGPRRERAEYALAVARGEVRGVFRVLGWRPRRRGDRRWEQDQPGKPRWGFDGEPAPELAHLVGLDVRSYFPSGAANPVRYVNCEGAAPPRADALLRSPEPRVEDLADVCARLHANPLLHLSLHSKELFHSNLLAWLVEAHPDLGAQLLAPWLEPDQGQEELRVERELHHLDVVVRLPGHRPLVIENKTFSLPDEAQLAGYDRTNIPAAGVEHGTRVLLSLADPGWRRWERWTWMSYEILAERLPDVVRALQDRAPFDAELLERYVGLLRDLLQVVRLTRVQDEDEPVALDADRAEVLRRVRLHDVAQKLRAQVLSQSLRETYREHGLQVESDEAGWGLGGVLMSAFVRVGQDDLVGWQLQSGQWRRFVICGALAGRGTDARDARAAYAAEQYAQWFDFTAEREVGPFQDMPGTGYRHFAPDFVYRYVRVPGLTVAELRRLAVAVVEQAQALAGAATSR